jgi:adenine-specific DNA-methyltransferase
MNKPEKLPMRTPDIADDKFTALAAMFPGAITETIDENGEVVRAIDADVLAQEINMHVVSGKQERYQFTWPDKKKSILLANAPIAAALRPCREESVDFDNTENLYIEGDNLDVLKLLRETYLNRVKMIYIDPPYNTGKDFIYEDDFVEETSEFLYRDGQYDEQGNRMVENFESNGRFHTDWLNMMYPRLRVARDLLAEDGAIFISIGQAESYNLIKCCDEIYGEQNRVSIISRVMKSGSAQGQYFSPNTEYILVYAKNITELKEFKQPISDEIINKLYTSVETKGDRKGEKYRPFGLYQSSLDPLRGCSNQRYYIEAPDGTLLLPPGNSMPKKDCDGAMVVPKSSDDKVWRWSKDRYIEEKKKGNIVFKKSNGVLIDSYGNPANWNVYTKIWLNDRKDEGMTPVDFIVKWENRLSKKELQTLNIPFDFAKPSELIKFLVSIVNNTNGSIILDFFSGSATTAHAVMQLNAEDGGKRKSIMVQLPELTDEKSEAYKAGYKNICEIGKERIRRAGAKIKEEMGLTAQGLDIGFRVLKLDSSNMKDVYYTPEEYAQINFDIDDFMDNIKSGRSGEDLLFQVMLDLGVPLSAKIEQKGQAFYVNDNYLIAYFDKADTDIITEIAKKRPYYAVFRDSSFKSDSDLVNFEQVFNTYSPNTIRRVL